MKTILSKLSLVKYSLLTRFPDNVHYNCRYLITSLNDEVVNAHLIYEELRRYPANFMKLSPFIMEIWSFETIHCLNLKTQRQKRHDVTNGVKVNSLICGFVGCMNNMLFLSNIRIYYP